jgi:5-deoxy-glucuronate isomerase
MSRLLIRAAQPAGERPVARVPLETAAGRAGESWRYVSLWTGTLRAGARMPIAFAEGEACVVLLSGRCRFHCADVDREVGERPDPFEGGPASVYVPCGTTATLTAIADADIAIGVAPAAPGPPACAQSAGSARREVRGAGAMERTIHHILMEDQPASSLLVTEVVTPAGHWSSYPPHKHDTDDPPTESALEEIYYFRFKDHRGFGLMRVYTADRGLDESIAVRDGDVVLVPRGYHTFSAAPGYEAYYLNVMAGPRREWKITFDPDHERMRW